VRLSVIAARVAARYAFKHEPKEKKQSKVDRITKMLRDTTGLSRGVAESIADALVRGRDVEGLAIQKGWPLEDSVVTGPDGTSTLSKLRDAV
jgi:hypothetical protein